MAEEAPLSETVPAEASTLEADRAQTSSARTLKQVARFAIRGQLGEGGMGVVLLAYDATLGREVALKLVHPSRGSGLARVRLLREAQAMARVTHPNVVAVYETGIHEDDVYVAMELVRGETLAAWLGEPRSVRAMLEMFVAAGRGLAAAHDAGILHRDFKPQNVLIGEEGRARVTDFGLSRALTDEEMAELKGADAKMPTLSPALAADITGGGAMLGTPGFMSPEHFLGETSAASDQFSFAISLYRAVFDEAPFAGRTIVDLRDSMREGPPAPKRRDVPPRITNAIHRALAFEPKNRWPSVTALVDELEAELRVDPDHDPRASLRQRRRVALFILAFAITNFSYFAYRTGFRFDVGLPGVMAFDGGALVLFLIIVSIFRRRVLADAYGRRVILFFPALLSTMLVDRAVGLLEGAAVIPVLRADAVFALALALLYAALLERWFVWVAIVMATYLVLSFVFPAAAIAAFGLSLITSGTLCVWFWRDPKSAGPALSSVRSSSDTRRKGS